MNVKLPAGTHLYRVATGPHGHSMVVKNKSIKPKPIKRKPSFPVYQPAPIAPIAPITITPAIVKHHIQQMLRSSRPSKGYRQWMQKKKRDFNLLLQPYSSLNQVLVIFVSILY